jgi:hypothetical protein
MVEGPGGELGPSLMKNLIPLARELAARLIECSPMTAVGLSEPEWQRLAGQTWAILQARRDKILDDLKTKKI